MSFESMDRERLNEIIDYVTRNPESYDQKTWTNIISIRGRVKKSNEVTINCNTTGCIAGHGAFRYSPAGTTFFLNQLKLPNGAYVDYEIYGKEVFNLDAVEANYIFSEARTLREIKMFVNDREFYQENYAETEDYLF